MSQATTLTITNCPCTITKPVITKPVITSPVLYGPILPLLWIALCQFSINTDS